MRIRYKFDIHKADAAARRILMQYSFFENSPEAAREKLLQDASILHCDSGQVLYGHDGPCDKVLLIGSGSVRVYVSGQSGREFTLYRVTAGEICPVNIQSACDNAGVVAYAQAEDRLEAVVIPANRFRHWLRDFAEAKQYLFESTFDRFVELIGRFRTITTHKIDRRLADFLLRKFAESDAPRPLIVMTHEDIASELGTVREVVGRRLQKLEGAAAVELGRGRIWLRDKEKLQDTLDTPGQNHTA